MITLARSLDGASLDLAVRPGPEPTDERGRVHARRAHARAPTTACPATVSIVIVAAGADGTGSMSLVVDRPLRLVLAPTRMTARGQSRADVQTSSVDTEGVR